MEPSFTKEPVMYSIAESRDGNPTLIICIQGREYPLHSRISPLREPCEPAPDHEKYDILIILGCGLGYSLLPLKDHIGKYRQVIIIDILQGIESDISKNLHTLFLTSAPNVRFITGKSSPAIEEILSGLVSFEGTKGIHVREHTASCKLFSEYYSGIKTSIKKLLDKKASAAATVKAFGRIFLRNALFNLENIPAMKPVSSLAGKFSGQRVLIVSSAPSVEEHIEEIRSGHGSFVIIAVDSAIPLLEKHGIIPELAVSVDPQQRIFEHFLGHEGRKTDHVFSIVSPPDIVEKYGGFISLNSHPVSQVIENFCPGLIGSIDSSTGSVAGDALALALLCGFESIAMTGFDFSFSHNRIYARGTAYQQRYSTMFNSRFKTPESFNAEYIFRSSRGYMDSGRYTRRSFTGYRDSLSRFIDERCPGKIMWISSGLVPAVAIPSTMENFLSTPAGCEKPGKGGYFSAGYTAQCRMPDMSVVKEFITRSTIWDELASESIGGEMPKAGGFRKLRERFRP